MNNEGIVRLPGDIEMREVTTPLSQIYDWSHEFVGIPDAWKHTKGKGAKVAVLDTGCDVQHEDLKGQIATASDFTRSLWGSSDRSGHGTWCCGCIVANAANNIGVAGMAPECELHSVKVLGDAGYGTEQSIFDGLRHAISLGVHVISASWGGGTMSQRFRKLLADWLNAPGNFFIAAAGNHGQGYVEQPASLANVVAVGAVRRDGTLTDFTARGPDVDILAPGQDMVSTVPSPIRYGAMSGTSMAAPVVAAVTSLCVAKHLGRQAATPLWTASQLIGHLRSTAIDPKSGQAGLINTEALLDLVPREQPNDELEEGLYKPVALVVGGLTLLVSAAEGGGALIEVKQ